MTIVGNITLIVREPYGESAVSFANQIVEIREEMRTARLGRDGKLVVTDHPKAIIWLGANAQADHLKNVFRIQIESHGRIMVDEVFGKGVDLPQQVPGGIRFDVTSHSDNF
jgi:hypothetical protein